MVCGPVPETVPWTCKRLVQGSQQGGIPPPTPSHRKTTRGAFRGPQSGSQSRTPADRIPIRISGFSGFPDFPVSRVSKVKVYKVVKVVKAVKVVKVVPAASRFQIRFQIGITTQPLGSGARERPGRLPRAERHATRAPPPPGRGGGGTDSVPNPHPRGTPLVRFGAKAPPTKHTPATKVFSCPRPRILLFW